MTPFHQIYESYSKDVYRFALYLSGDPALADDITSETFIRVWSSPDPLRMSTVKGYLFTIARRLFLMERRRGARTEALDDPARNTTPAVLRESEAKAENRLDSAAELDRVLNALQQLPESDRAALLMRANDDLSYQEIALSLGLSVTAAKVKVHRSRLKLAHFRNPARPEPTKGTTK